jgi:hypothetical protein
MTDHHDHKYTPQAMDRCESTPYRLRHEADNLILMQDIEDDHSYEYYNSQSEIYEVAVEHIGLFYLHIFFLSLPQLQICQIHYKLEFVILLYPNLGAPPLDERILL